MKRVEIQISPPAVFNPELGFRIKSQVDQEGLTPFPALRLAKILAFYNFKTLGGNYGRVEARISRLVEAELVACDWQNPLPTIGFEVEASRKLFQERDEKNKYIDFFDNIKMPRNRANADSSAVDFWEFSPPPSYSALVSARLLCELIKGGFIPFLRNSKEPAHIREYLDDKLVSLHLNLGIPDRIEEGLTYSGSNPDVLLFSSMFAYGFTSPLRLQYRTLRDFIRIKGADKTSKSGGQHRRLELTAFEVRTETTYRLMEEVQLMGAALFASFGDFRPDLALVWRKISEQARMIYERYEVKPEFLKDDKTKAAQKAANPEFVRTLRHLITTAALDIRYLINPS